MQQFFCVYTFNGPLQDYECIGVFTKREDAEAYALDPPHPGHKFPIITRTFRELIDSEIKMRLGRLADILFPKEQAELDARQERAVETGESIDFTVRATGEFTELRSSATPSLPVDVARCS